MSEWRDIKTAPKDGTYCDLWSEIDGRRTDCWFMSGKWYEYRWDDFGNGNSAQTVDAQKRITHWMPVPDGPTNPGGR